MSTSYVVYFSSEEEKAKVLDLVRMHNASTDKGQVRRRLYS